ncbi:hypothetical protein SOVF_093120 [Spinacia oleracea]|uniref:Uncharacterized protein At1g66480-like n=1 Tax=Spinacia oleracea TaxID=3562 RepID=A0A9R0JKH2_SPIOL|nr:uncharacterized protein At1g66480-like [Spinacia oleracea]KNA16011.1 hypothetical protein SOVF_093120 [Spinacia oleracea]
MGNNMGGGSSKSAKIMKINGENFKLKIPVKVFDVIKDYPDHILLDSEEFLRFNLRAKPLNPEDELKPRKIYLLVELPKFPLNNQSPLRKVRSSVLASTATNRDVMMMKKESRRSASDDLTILTRSTAADFVDVDDGGDGSSPVGPTRVKMRLSKARVQKIMEESGDDNLEAAKRIIRLCLKENAAVSSGDVAVEEIESDEDVKVETHCLNVYGMCSPCSIYRSKYKKLTS